MLRSAFVLVFLQGTFFVFLANGLTTSKPLEDNTGLKDGSGPPQYRVNDTKEQPCIIMEMDAHISFKWEMESNKTQEMDTYVQPKQVITTGYCRDDAQISVTWKSVQMKWTFAKTRDAAKWFAKEVEVQYNNSFTKTNNSEPSNATTWTSRDVLLFSAPMGSAYHCTEEYSLLLNSTKNDSATLLLRRFRVQPFLKDSSFGPNYCPTDSNNVAGASSTIGPISSSSEDSTSDASNVSDMATQISVSSTEILNSSPHSTDDSSIADKTDPSHGETTSVPLISFKTGSPSYQPEHLSNDIGTGITTQPLKPVHSTSTFTSSAPSLPMFQNHKALSNSIQIPPYPSKKMFYSGVKINNNNDALSSMLWSWYSSGFYTGYYQALQQQKKTQ